MNYILQINGFWDRLLRFPLKTSSIAVYHALLHKNNRLAWREKFSAHHEDMMELLSISKNTYYDCIKELVNQGYIQYELSQNRVLSGKIKINLLSQNLVSELVSEQYQDCDSTCEASCDSTSTLNKPINIKQIKPINTVFIAPTILDVKDFFLEKGFSEELASRAWNYYEAANWSDSTGKKIKNWKQKMIGVWLKPENVKKLKIANGESFRLSKSEELLRQNERLKATFFNDED